VTHLRVDAWQDGSINFRREESIIQPARIGWRGTFSSDHECDMAEDMIFLFQVFYDDAQKEILSFF